MSKVNLPGTNICDALPSTFAKCPLCVCAHGPGIVDLHVFKVCFQINLIVLKFNLKLEHRDYLHSVSVYNHSL